MNLIDAGVITATETESSILYSLNKRVSGIEIGSMTGGSYFGLQVSRTGVESDFKDLIDPTTGVLMTFLFPATGDCVVPLNLINTMPFSYFKVVLPDAAAADINIKAIFEKI